VPRGLGVFAPTLKAKLSYSDYLGLTSTGGSVGQQVWRLNDTYDPDLTGSGHQWLYRDQLYSMYQYCRVTYVSIQIKVTSTADPATSVGHVSLGPAQSGGADSSVTTLIERPGSKYGVCTYGTNPLVLSWSTGVDRYFGQKRGHVLYSDGFEQPSTASLAAAFSVYCQLLYKDHGGATSYLRGSYRIVMYCQFEQKIQVAAS